MDSSRGPTFEIGCAGAHGHCRIHARAAPEHLAPQRCHVVAESKVILGVVTPVVRLVTADVVGVGDGVGIVGGRVHLPGFQQQYSSSGVLAQSVREHRSGGSSADDDDVQRFSLVGHETFLFR